MINRQLIANEWRERVSPNHNVPVNLYDHQLDAMGLLHEGKHVFLGNIPPSPLNNLITSILRSSYWCR